MLKFLNFPNFIKFPFQIFGFSKTLLITINANISLLYNLAPVIYCNVISPRCRWLFNFRHQREKLDLSYFRMFYGILFMEKILSSSKEIEFNVDIHSVQRLRVLIENTFNVKAVERKFNNLTWNLIYRQMVLIWILEWYRRCWRNLLVTNTSSLVDFIYTIIFFSYSYTFTIWVIVTTCFLKSYHVLKPTYQF